MNGVNCKTKKISSTHVPYQTLSCRSLHLHNPEPIVHMVTEDSHILSWEGMMSLVLWYGSICFYFQISSISALTLTYYDAQYQHDALHELHEPLQLLTLNARFFAKSLLLAMPRIQTNDL